VHDIEVDEMEIQQHTLHEEVTFDQSRVASVDWASYPVLRFPEAPAVEVALIDHPDQPDRKSVV
jgi:nicotinate dehydrogenase subunit B